jgi:hypothetical protein
MNCHPSNHTILIYLTTEGCKKRKREEKAKEKKREEIKEKMQIERRMMLGKKRECRERGGFEKSRPPLVLDRLFNNCDIEIEGGRKRWIEVWRVFRMVKVLGWEAPEDDRDPQRVNWILDTWISIVSFWDIEENGWGRVCISGPRRRCRSEKISDGEMTPEGVNRASRVTIV